MYRARGALIALPLFLASCTAPPPTEPSPAPAPTEDRAEGKIGEAVHDGSLQFIVEDFHCGVSDIGIRSAQGQFCLLGVRFTNTGNEPVSLFAGNQYLRGADTRYAVNELATWAAKPEDGDNVFMVEMNPGITLTGTLVFDVPPGVEPTRAELHDSAFSQGAVVRLWERSDNQA